MSAIDIFCGALETVQRQNGDEYVRLKASAPKWCSNLVYALHGARAPNDCVYDMIAECAQHIVDGGGVDTVEADIYDSQLLSYLVECGTEYCDQAQDDGLITDSATLIERISAGQYLHKQALCQQIIDICDEIDDAEEEESEGT